RENTVRGRIDGRSVDTILAHRIRELSRKRVRVGGGADHGQHFAHLNKARRRGVGIDLGIVRVEQGDLVYPVTIATSGVVVVLGKYQVGGGAVIRRNHGSWHDGRRVIPTESARRFFSREITAEAEEKSTRTIARVAQ